jgi:hypothetical protein
LFQAARSPTDGPSQVGTPIPDNNFASVGELRPQNAKLVSSSPGAVHVLQRDVQPGDVIGKPFEQAANPTGQIDLAVSRHLHVAGA